MTTPGEQEARASWLRPASAPDLPAAYRTKEALEACQSSAYWSRPDATQAWDATSRLLVRATPHVTYGGSVVRIETNQLILGRGDDDAQQGAG